MYKPLLLLTLFVASVASLLLAVGCAREYSYEWQPKDTITASPTPAVEPPFLTSCTACRNNTAPGDSVWQFNVGATAFCGKADKAIIVLERTAFTFFGPSTCSEDSGFIATVYLNEALDRDKQNISARYVALYYYDRITGTYPLISRAGVPVYLVIENYNHQTKEVSGRFNGTAFAKSGEQKIIRDGRFRLRFDR